MKKFLAVAVAAIIFLTAHALAANYVGNANTKKFHYTNCSSAERIKVSNRVEFSSRDAAVAAGYVPCKRCSP